MPRVNVLPRTRWARTALVVVSAVAPVFSAVAVNAADQPKKPNWAAVEPAQVDADFRFQGEYSGTATLPGLTAPTGAAQPEAFARSAGVGLQVVALGNGQFSAVCFPGGLSGAGGRAKERIALTGTRDGGRLELIGIGLAAQVNEAGTATLLTSDGRVLGTLAKVERRSPTEGLGCPPDGTPLYTDDWKQGFKNSRRTKDRLLMVGTETKHPLRDFTMHLEFRLPYMPYARGQGRANSGVYLHSRYEVQILDSFGLEGKNNECGSLYTYKAPDINMCYPPLRWQTYDIEFRAPRFDASGRKTRNGRLTVKHNGVAVQDDFAFERKTGAGQPEGPISLPTKLQDHGNPVHFRNVWVVDHDQPVPLMAEPPLPPQTPGPLSAFRPQAW